MNATDAHQQTLNSCFGALDKVWVHLGPFRYGTNLYAKWTEPVLLMQKFMPRSGVEIFRYEHTRSTKMDPKLMSFCVSQCLVAFGIVSLLH